MPLEENPKSIIDYNTIASELNDQGIDALYLMSWLEELRRETFWHFPQNGTVSSWRYSAALRNFLDSTSLLDSYRERIPALFLLRRNSDGTGKHNGVQFTEVMDKTLVWISQHISHLVSVHRLDDSVNINHGIMDMTEWICKKWLQYQMRYHVREFESAREASTDGADRQAHDLCPKPASQIDGEAPQP